jgi:hypothetical protein
MQTALHKLAALADSHQPQRRRAWRHWQSHTFAAAQHSALLHQRATLALGHALFGFYLRATSAAWARWRAFCVAHASRAAAAALAAQLEQQDWRVGAARTLQRCARAWEVGRLRDAVVAWQRRVAEAKLADQVREQRLLAVEKLEGVGSSSQRRRLRSAWQRWGALASDTKSNEAARKVKSTFKRIKRDLRKASRAQGLGMLERVAGRLAVESKGFAFHHWATLCVSEPREAMERRRAGAVWRFAAARDALAGPKAVAREAWAQWRAVVDAARRAADAAARDAAVAESATAATRAGRRQAGARHLAAVLATALRRRAKRALEAWVGALDAEEDRREKEQWERERGEVARKLEEARKEVRRAGRERERERERETRQTETETETETIDKQIDR